MAGEQGAIVDGEEYDERRIIADERTVTLRLSAFAWRTATRQAASSGMTLDELVNFSVLYYLADLDSGRIARHRSIPRPV